MLLLQLEDGLAHLGLPCSGLYVGSAPVPRTVKELICDDGLAVLHVCDGLADFSDVLWRAGLDDAGLQRDLSEGHLPLTVVPDGLCFTIAMARANSA